MDYPCSPFGLLRIVRFYRESTSTPGREFVNLLTPPSITTGISGPLVFGIGLPISSLIIILTSLVFMIPVAWIGTIGPKTGMRQIVQTRYYFGYVLYFSGYLSLTYRTVSIWSSSSPFCSLQR